MNRLIALMLLAGATRVQAQITTPCKDSSQYAANIVQRVRTIAASSDTASTSSRIMVNLPSNPIPDSLVKIVTQDSVCNAVVAALTPVLHWPSQPTAPHEVMKIGNYYAVWRRNSLTGLHLPVFFLDAQLNYLKTLLM